jgi:hypothetical protein
MKMIIPPSRFRKGGDGEILENERGATLESEIRRILKPIFSLQRTAIQRKAPAAARIFQHMKGYDINR